MAEFREIRADYDRTSIVVYQAFNDSIAEAALRAQRLVPPFSVRRMTWIKPSFLWLMDRSGWATKNNQERILGVRILRTGWDRALSLGVLTSFDARVHGAIETWQARFSSALAHVQWDPERSLRGAKLEYRSIQIGLSRRIIEEYVQDWTVQIQDMTPLVAKLRRLREAGLYQDAKRLLPAEQVYPVEKATIPRLGMNC